MVICLTIPTPIFLVENVKIPLSSVVDGSLIAPILATTPVVASVCSNVIVAPEPLVLFVFLIVIPLALLF